MNPSHVSGPCLPHAPSTHPVDAIHPGQGSPSETALGEGLTSFAAALLNPDQPCPQGWVAWNGSDPTHRLGVYRNNVVVSLVDALAATFPVTQQLVGEDFFRAMAREFVGRHPPQSKIMTWLGLPFADFVATFSPAASVPYLADVARLEMTRVKAYHAADQASLDLPQLATWLADAEQLAQTVWQLHPSGFTLVSAFAVNSIWQAHQADVVDLTGITIDQPEAVWVVRQGMQVLVHPVSPAQAGFYQALASGLCLSHAAALSGDEDPFFDLAGALALLIQSGGVTAIQA